MPQKQKRASIVLNTENIYTLSSSFVCSTLSRSFRWSEICIFFSVFEKTMWCRLSLFVDGFKELVRQWMLGDFFLLLFGWKESDCWHSGGITIAIIIIRWSFVVMLWKCKHCVCVQSTAMERASSAWTHRIKRVSDDYTQHSGSRITSCAGIRF